METIGKAEAKQIGEATTAALQEVAERFGLTVQFKGGRYDPTVGTYKPKIEFHAAGSARKSFEEKAWQVGLKPDDFEKTFASRGEFFQIVGINTRAHRFPIIASKVGQPDRRFKFPEETVRTALAGG